MKIFNFLFGVLSPLSFVLSIWRKGDYVGTDNLGNKYYRANPRKGYKLEQRWVYYAGEPAADRVPPEWHGWLHHQTNAVPDPDGLSYRKAWQLPHKPNMTGTDLAYLPPGHETQGSQRAPATGDYQAWKPE